MLESLLVADRGLGAARVLTTCRRLGIKSVLAKLSVDTDSPVTDAGRRADDVVLLADLDELSDPVAVIRAAAAAGVQAVHPGYGPLRGDARLARAAADAGLLAIVTVIPAGVGGPDDVAAVLGGHHPPVRFVPGERPMRWVYVLGTPTAAIVLGSVQLDAAGRTIAGDDAPSVDDPSVNDPSVDDPAAANVVAANPVVEDPAAVDAPVDDPAVDGATARRAAHAAAAVLGLHGLAAIGVGAGGVTAVVPGLPEHHAGWELVTGLDLVEQQLLLATGRLGLDATADIAASGVAIGRAEAQVVADVRRLDDLRVRSDDEALRLETVALAGSAHGALVQATAWGADREVAERVLARYVQRADRPD